VLKGSRIVIVVPAPSAETASIAPPCGQPTANQAKTPPAIPNRLGASPLSSVAVVSAMPRGRRTQVAASIPARTDDAIQTG